MSVHYKFKSALEYDTVTFDGLHISVKDLKKAILHQKKIGKTSDFDLQVTNAQTKETYSDDNALIPKNTSLIIARIPLTQQQRKQWEREKQSLGGKLGDVGDQSVLGQVDISSLDLSEEDKIKTMISQSTSDYDPSNYIKVKGGNQVGVVPTSYVCFKCHQRGHWIKDCPNVDSSNLVITDPIKKSTGIPRSFMIEVEGPQVPGARMTPSGVYAVPVIDHEVYKEKKIEKPPFLAEKEKPVQTPSIPEDLLCGICKDLLQDAVMVPCCGISFCDECIRNVLVDSDESECPDCNEKDVSPDTLIPNRFLRTSVNTFKNKTGYVKNKPQVVQRQPSPPRPSLPDFVPPPEYVDPTARTDIQRQNRAESSPVYQQSPSTTSTALQFQHSPYQSQTTPIYSEQASPFGDNSNSYPPPDQPAYQESPFSQNQFSGPPPGPGFNRPYFGPNQFNQFPGPRYPGPDPGSGPFPNFQHPPPNFHGRFSEPVPPGVPPPIGKTSSISQRQSDSDRKPGDQKDRNSRHDRDRDSRAGSGTPTTVPGEDTPKSSGELSTQENGVKDGDKTERKVGETEIKTHEKLKKVGIDVDDVSSVSSTASEEPPPPAVDRRPIEGQDDSSQGPSYAIPSLFSGQHPVTLPPPGTGPYPPIPRGNEPFPLGSGEERSNTPTVDERLEIPPMRPPFDPYRPPNFMVPPGFDPHFGMMPPHQMPYDPNMMYDRNYRGPPRPRMHRGRYAMRQPPPPGSRPLTPPGSEEEAFIAFQRMLKEKEEQNKRKLEKLKARSNSRSRSRSAARSRRSFSGARSRSRTRSRTPPRRSRSRSKKRTRSRSRSFVMSRSRSRSYSRSPLHERNYSPRKYYTPPRSPLRYDRYDAGYNQWSQEQHRDYRRGGYRSRGRGRFYNKNSPPRGREHQPYNRYRDENYVTSSPPRHFRSPNRYYEQRTSPRPNDYPRGSRDRDYTSYDRETDSTVRDRSVRRRSHSSSLVRNNHDSERDRDRDRGRDRDRERGDGYRHRSRSRRSESRKFSPSRKTSQERSERSKEKSPETRHKDWDPEKEGRNRSRERRGYDGAKDKRKYSRDRDRSKEVEKESKKHKSRSRSRDKVRQEKDRSRSYDAKRKRSGSRDKRKRSRSSSRKRRSSSRHRKSVSRSKEERSPSPERHRKRSHSESAHREKKRSLSRQREDANEVIKRSPSREKERDLKQVLRNASPKTVEKEEEDRKEKRKDKEKKKKKKEKETEEERAARKKRKREKKEEKKRKQEQKAAELRDKESKAEDSRKEVNESPTPVKIEAPPNFVSSFKSVETEVDGKSSPTTDDSVHNKTIDSTSEPTAPDIEMRKHDLPEPGEIVDQEDSVEVKDEGSETSGSDRRRKTSPGDTAEEMDAEVALGDENVALEIHASYESLLEESGENQKKGILAPIPEKSKWELEEKDVADTRPSLTDSKSPEFPTRVTREVLKRAENAIFKRAVNAIREPSKKPLVSDKDDKRERKLIVAPERERSKEHSRSEQDGEKVRRIFIRDKEKAHRSSIEIPKSKTEIKRTINSLQITVPVATNNESKESAFSSGDRTIKTKLNRKEDRSARSPPAGRISVKERLGSKVDKVVRNSSPHIVRAVEKRSRNTDDDPPSRKEYQARPTLSSTIESIDPKRSTIDEAHFVPNYDESSDEEENPKARHQSEKESKSNLIESKKRARSSSESSEESTKKHKKKKSKSKKKKQKRSKKHVTDSSESSDSEREQKKKHKKSKKKKKSKH